MSAVDSSLTRQQAISEAKKIWADSEWCSEGVVKILEALGVVRFKPTVKYEVCPPKQAIKDTSAHRRRQARCTGATWSDAVVIFPGEVLAFQNIERQAYALRAKALGSVTPPIP